MKSRLVEILKSTHFAFYKELYTLIGKLRKMELPINVLLKNVKSDHTITMAKSPFTIGRALSSDYIIENKIISRTHCTFTKVDEGWTLTDSSTNGTFVNETHIKGATSALLKENDEIYLGHEDYTYKFLICPLPNAQIEKIKHEEASLVQGTKSCSPNTSSVSSPVSFDENGVSDEQLNSLADNILNALENNNPEPSLEPSVAEDNQKEENQPTVGLQEQPILQQNAPSRGEVEEAVNVDESEVPTTTTVISTLPSSQSSTDTMIYSLSDQAVTDTLNTSVPQESHLRAIDTPSSPSELANALTKAAEDSSSTSVSLLQRATTATSSISNNIQSASTLLVNSLSTVVPCGSPAAYAVSSISNSHKKLKIVRLPLLPDGSIRKLTPNELKELISANKVASVISLGKNNRVTASTSKDSPLKVFQVINTPASSSNNVPPSTSSSSDHQILDSSNVPAAVQEVIIKDTAEKTTTVGEPGPSKIPDKADDGNKQSHFEEMEDELTCTICANMFIKAVTLGCSHSFCQYCIETWKKKKSECPICRTKITLTTRTLVLDNFIERMLKNASEQDKQVRKEALEGRRKSEEAEKNKNLTNQRSSNTARRGRNRGGNQRNNNTRNPGVPF